MQRCFWVPLTEDPDAAMIEHLPLDLWTGYQPSWPPSLVFAQVWFSKLERRVPERL